jgi:UDP-N-acetylmuramate: L-alanyl-gamma-D-glutamyl-meso-diaminopimelate ligase
MLTWILERAGARPDYLIGGTAHNLEHAARFAGSTFSVVEGDEYASCFDDQTPKFLYYAPEVVLLTNLISDHPDLYPDASDLHRAFRALFQRIPAHGRLIIPSEDESAVRLADDLACHVVTTGMHRSADLPIADLHLSSGGSAFRISSVLFNLPVFGAMNVRNAAMAAAAALHFDIALEQSARALAEFEGVDNRQAGLDIGRCTLVVDKATHPQSIGELCQALRQRYPGRRLVSVIQPRGTGGRNWIYQRDLPKVLAGFDRVILTNAYEHKPAPWTSWQAEPFSIETLVAALRALLVHVTTVHALDDLPRAVRALVREGDVVLLSLREQFVAHIPAVKAALEDHGRMSHRRNRALTPRPERQRSTSVRSSST